MMKFWNILAGGYQYMTVNNVVWYAYQNASTPRHYWNESNETVMCTMMVKHIDWLVLTIYDCK